MIKVSRIESWVLPAAILVVAVGILWVVFIVARVDVNALEISARQLQRIFGQQWQWYSPWIPFLR